MDCCQVFWCYLAKNKNQQSQNAGCDSYICVSQNLYVSVVMREETDIFTMLFPIKIVLSIFPELEIIFSRIMARLFPCSAREWIRMRLAAVIGCLRKEEKKAGQQHRISMVTAV